MNYRRHMEAIKREQRRIKIFAHECPECGGHLNADLKMGKMCPRYLWFKCERCATVMGVGQH